MMAHPEGGRDPKDYPGNFDGGLGKMLAITGFTAEASSFHIAQGTSVETRPAVKLTAFLFPAAFSSRER